MSVYQLSLDLPAEGTAESSRKRKGRPPVDPRRRCIKFLDWPAKDQEQWRVGTTPNDDLDDPNFGGSIKPRALKKIEQSYGRWLGFLTWTDSLENADDPAARVTPARVRAYFKLMRELGNRDHTMVGRLEDLTTALRIIVPQRDFRWVRSPDGVPMRSRLPMEKRDLAPRDSEQLYEWGIQLMELAFAKPSVRRRVGVRDGLMIAIFACRAPRLRSTTAMRLGRNVVRSKGDFRLVFYPEDMKTEGHLEFPLPMRLTPYIERYIGIERIELLNGAKHDAFWVNWSGEPLGEVGVEKRVRWLSEKKFGEAFGPHEFRRAYATTQAIRNPTNPAAGAAVLANSPEVLEEYYNLGGQIEAANSFLAGIAADRQSSRDRARQIFDDDGD